MNCHNFAFFRSIYVGSRRFYAQSWKFSERFDTHRRLLSRGENAPASELLVDGGFSSTAAADQIVAAIYLDSSGHYGLIPSPGDLFPSPDHDRLGSFIGSLGASASTQLQEILRDLYWIADKK
jgi:hypothetical protein